MKKGAIRDYSKFSSECVALSRRAFLEHSIWLQRAVMRL